MSKTLSARLWPSRSKYDRAVPRLKREHGYGHPCKWANHPEELKWYVGDAHRDRQITDKNSYRDADRETPESPVPTR